MATDSFKFWDSYMRALDRVDDATAGRLVKALCHEVFEDVPARFEDEPMLGMVYDVMLGQAVQSRDLSRSARERGKKAAGVAKPNARKSSAKQSLDTYKHPLSEKKRSEANRNEASLLSTDNDQPAPPPAP